MDLLRVLIVLDELYGVDSSCTVVGRWVHIHLPICILTVGIMVGQQTHVTTWKQIITCNFIFMSAKTSAYF